MTSLKNKLPSVPMAANIQQLKINSHELSIVVSDCLFDESFIAKF